MSHQLIDLQLYDPKEWKTKYKIETHLGVNKIIIYHYYNNEQAIETFVMKKEKQ